MQIENNNTQHILNEGIHNLKRVLCHVQWFLQLSARSNTPIPTKELCGSPSSYFMVKITSMPAHTRAKNPIVSPTHQHDQSFTFLHVPRDPCTPMLQSTSYPTPSIAHAHPDFLNISSPPPYQTLCSTTTPPSVLAPPRLIQEDAH